MSKIMLKDGIFKQQLLQEGFVIKNLGDKQFIIRNRFNKEGKDVVVQIEPYDGELKWRFQENKELSQEHLLAQVSDVLDLFDYERKKPSVSSEKLNELANEIHQNAIEHGWWETNRNFGEIIALIHSELSEALEEYRNNKPMHYKGENGKPEGIAVELIDVIIRVLDYLGKEGVDIDKLLKEKHEYNKTREYKHGNKKV